MMIFYKPLVDFFLIFLGKITFLCLQLTAVCKIVYYLVGLLDIFTQL
jgi:hypothetical protein